VPVNSTRNAALTCRSMVLSAHHAVVALSQKKQRSKAKVTSKGHKQRSQAKVTSKSHKQRSQAKVTSAADGAAAAELACSAMHGPTQFLRLVPAHSLCNLAAGKSAAGKTAAAAKGGKNSGKVRTASTLVLV